jgi:hypothetical protein
LVVDGDLRRAVVGRLRRVRDALRACFDRALGDAAPRPSRLRAREVARERFGDAFRRREAGFCPSAFARSALRRVFSEA